MKLTLLCSLFLSFIVCLPANAQKQLSSGQRLPQPKESALAIPRFPMHVAELPTPKVDAARVQRDAKQLLELSQSLQPDIDSVNRGLLPKDTLEKLKRIEKLSKHLRSQLAP